MTGNRVEKLEEKVRELEATVSGLTDELVETKERLRIVEEHAGAGIDSIIDGKTSRSEARRSADGRRQQTQEPGTQEAVEEAVENTNADGEPAADEAKSDESKGEEESSEQSDDIIVA